MKKLALLGVLSLLGLSSCLAEDDWEVIGESDGIKVSRRDVEGSPVVAFKGEAVIRAPIAKVANVLDDTSRKLEWVCNAVETKNVKIISPTERIEYNHTHAPWPIKDRDFVYHAVVKADRKERTLTFDLESVEDPGMPVDEDKAVRGALLHSSYVLKDTGDGRTRLTVEIHADPKGSVPKWVVNLFQKSWPRETIEGIRSQCRKADVPELAVVKDLLDKEPAVAAITSGTRKG